MPKKTQRKTPAKGRRAATTSRKKPARRAAPTRRRSGLRLHHITAIMFICALLGIGLANWLNKPFRPAHAASCSVNAILVNSCRPWLGAWANLYPGHTNTGMKDQILDHENRVGRQMDLVHAYSGPGDVLSSDNKYFITRPNTTLLLNWKPTLTWASAAGGNSTVNAQIDAMANSIKAMAPHKIMLIIFHEPENDVTPSTTSCTSVGTDGTAGSPTDYINMWHNVRARFNAAGVSNVVWGMNYMSWNGGTCPIKELWPGNSYVDWVWADPYITGSITYTSRMDFTYNWFKNNSDATHDFNSKPWGFAEWGAHQTTQTQAYAVYDQAKADLDANRYPNLKAYVIFDSTSGPKGGGAVGLTDAGTADPTELQHYKTFASDPRFTDGYYAPPPPADITAPNVSITGPSNGSAVSGTVSVSVSASDNVGVSSVSLNIDGTSIGSDTSSPYSFSVTTPNYGNGSHSLTATATDAAGNHATSTISVTVSNSGAPSDPTPPGSGGGTTVIDPNNTPSDQPVAVTGSVVIKPATPGASVSLQVDGKKTDGNSIDTTKLTNGVHTVTVTEDGKTKQIQIAVHNSWYRNVVNRLRTEPVKLILTAGLPVAGVGAGLWVFRPRIAQLVWHFKTRNYIRF
jgi:hypothetical protein